MKMQDTRDADTDIPQVKRGAKSQAICTLHLKDVEKGWSAGKLNFQQAQVLGDVVETYLQAREGVVSLPSSLASAYSGRSFEETRDQLVEKGLLCRQRGQGAVAPTRAGMQRALKDGRACARLTANGEDVIAADDCALVVPNASVAFTSALQDIGSHGSAPLAAVAERLGFTDPAQIMAVAWFARKLSNKGRIQVRFPSTGIAEVVDLLRIDKTTEQTADDLRALKVEQAQRPMVEKKPIVSAQDRKAIHSLVAQAGSEGLSVLDVYRAMPHLGVGQIFRILTKSDSVFERFKAPRDSNGARRRSDTVRFMYRCVANSDL